MNTNTGNRKRLTGADKAWIRGLAFAAAFLADSHREDSLARDLIEQSGHDYGDFVAAKCDAVDLEPIARVLRISEAS